MCGREKNLESLTSGKCKSGATGLGADHKLPFSLTALHMAHSTATLAKGCFGKVYKEKYNDTWAAIKRVPQHLIKKTDLERECEVYK